MRIRIDSEECSGHGRCYAFAPDLVEPDDDGRAVVVRELVPNDLEDAARRAAGNCPEHAVKLEE